MTKYVGAIDQGTTGTRFMVIDENGKEVASAYQEHRQIFPQPGWVEHDPMEILEKTIYVIKRALDSVDMSLGNLDAIGITNQRETTVFWDEKTGKPLYNAIVWQDLRTSDLVAKFRHHEKRIREITGLPVSTYFSALKIRWLLEKSDKVREAANKGTLKVGTIDAWLVWNLTNGNHVTDVTNASRTMLMDLKSLQWSDELLELFDIPENILPQIVPSGDPECYGTISSSFLHVSRENNAEVPITAVIGDQQGALVGQLCFEEGMAKSTYGTGAFLLENIGTKPILSSSGLLTTVAYQLKDQAVHYALEGSVAIAGAVVQWLRDQLGIISQSSEVEDLARQVPDNGGVYFVPAFTGLFAPHWDETARGIIIGLTRASNKHHLARAALESIAFSCYDVFNAMIQDSGKSIATLRVDGGASKNDLLMQFQSDILGVPCERPKNQETTALGASFIAGLTSGLWNSMTDLERAWELDKAFKPSMDSSERLNLLKKWKKAIERSMKWETI